MHHARTTPLLAKARSARTTTRLAGVLAVSLASACTWDWQSFRNGLADAGNPVCTRTPTVDSTGRDDVTAGLQSFFDQTPDGTSVCLASGGQYRIEGRLELRGRAGLTIDGRGARLFATTRSDETHVQIAVSSDMHLRNVVIEGYNPEAGTSSAFNMSYQGGAGLIVSGVTRCEVGPNVTVRNVSGDGIYVTGGVNATSDYQWSDTVNVHDSVIERTGRYGLAITDGGKNIVVERTHLDAIALYAFTIQPNGQTYAGVAAGATNVRISDNPIGTYALSPMLAPWFFAGGGNGPQTNVEVSRNVLTGSVLRVGAWDDGGGRMDFRVLDNRSDTRAPGPTMDFSGVNTLTVQGNTQPLASGTIAMTTNCTNVMISNNTTM